jgi:hypothetical protein
MVGKKIKNQRKSAPKAVRIGRLLRYVLNPETENGGEKCIYAGARGFLTDAPDTQAAEMLALSVGAVRSLDTIGHYALSWRDGEQPTVDQVEEAVSIFMSVLGLDGHQVVYALHADTENIHLHLVINRVHPDSFKVIKPNRGFDIEAVHRAVAVIEYRQGWQREQNGRYQVLGDGSLCRARQIADTPRLPDQPKSDMERRTGEKSAERVAIEDGAPIISRATSWQTLHAQLAEVGLRYEKTGSGAVVFVGNVRVKASRVDRGASLLQLQKRLGPYEPSSLPYLVAVWAPQPVKLDVRGWDIYIAGRKAHHAAREAAVAELKQRQEAERKYLAGQQKAYREDFLKGSWKGRGALWNARQSILAAGQAGEKAALKERHQQERRQLRLQYRPYPDLEAWQRQHQFGRAPEQRGHHADEPPRIEGDETGPPTLRDIRDYVPEIHGQQVHYTHIEEAGLSGHAAFIDRGRAIDIHDWRNRASVLAALQLAAQKWGSFRVSGNDEYKAMCVQLAAEHGFRISNPELEESIQRERQWIRQAAPAARSKPRRQTEGPGMG